MGSKPNRRKSDSKALLAWSALLVIIIWLGLSWPRDGRGPVQTGSPAATATDTAATTTVEPAKATGSRAEIITELLNLRSEPDADKKKIMGTLRKGLVVRVIEKQPGWLRVKLDDGRSGYIAHEDRFIRFLEE